MARMPATRCLQPVALDLVGMDGDEGRIDGQQAELASQGAGMEQGALTQTQHGNVDRGAGFVQPHVLEVVHEEHVVAFALGPNRPADDLARKAKLGECM